LFGDPKNGYFMASMLKSPFESLIFSVHHAEQNQFLWFW